MGGKLTYANVMSTIAVFLALTGGLAWALDRNSVKSKHIVNGTIRSIDVAGDALTGGAIDESSLGKVPRAASADSAEHADAADTATNAQSALNAANAADAAKLQGHPASDFLLGNAFHSAAGSDTITSTTTHGNWPAGSCVLGEMIPWAANFHTTGTLFAHGQLLAISSNTQLFSLLGNTYGGDGVSTFALPDARNEGPGGTDWLICVTGLYPAAG